MTVSFYFSQINAVSATAGSNGSCIFSFLRNYQIVFPEWLCHFTVPFATYEWQSCSASLSAFGVVTTFILVILIGVGDISMVVFIDIPLIANDVEHLFLSLCSICISSLMEYLFMSFSHTLIESLAIFYF